MTQYLKLSDEATGREYTFTIDISGRAITISMPDQPEVTWEGDPVLKPVRVKVYVEDDRLNVDTTYPNVGNDDDHTPLYGLLSSDDVTPEAPKMLDIR